MHAPVALRNRKEMSYFAEEIVGIKNSVLGHASQSVGTIAANVEIGSQ
jgi:hypothetical protein